MNRTPIPDEVLRGVLAEVDATFNVGPITQVLVAMLRADPLVTFARAERQLRALGSRTYLLALPASDVPPGLDARHPASEGPATHFLWICLHGPVEAEETMRYYGIASAEENMAALETCGVLTPRIAGE
jgi:hypothetical protein